MIKAALTTHNLVSLDSLIPIMPKKTTSWYLYLLASSHLVDIELEPTGGRDHLVALLSSQRFPFKQVSQFEKKLSNLQKPVLCVAYNHHMPKACGHKPSSNKFLVLDHVLLPFSCNG